MQITLQDWLQSFWRIIASPTPSTFLAEAKKADGKFASAIAWLVFWGVYLCGLVWFALGAASLVALIIAVFLPPLAVLLLTSAMHFTYQRLAHRRAYVYDKLLYLAVAILLPLQFILTPLFLFLPGPITLIFCYVIIFYQIILLSIALQAIAAIHYWQALLSVTISILVSLLACAVVVLLVYGAVAGPLLAQ